MALVILRTVLWAEESRQLILDSQLHNEVNRFLGSLAMTLRGGRAFVAGYRPFYLSGLRGGLGVESV